jgi:cytochrome P450
VTDKLGLLRSQFARDQISDLELEETHVQNMLSVVPMGMNGWTNVFDIMPLLFRLTIDSSTEFIFGESLDVQLAALPNYTRARGPLPMSETEFASAFDAAQAAVAKGAILNHLYWLVHDREFKENCRRCHVFIDHYVQLALRKEKKTSDAIDVAGKIRYIFLDGLVETTHDPIRLRGQLLSILVASRDTTASLLSFVFMVFTQHPHIYAKLRGIIIEHFGTADAPKNLTFENLKACNYLQWVLSETLRLYPVIPINVRRALRDTTLPRGGGPDGQSPIYIRKGEGVDYSYYVIHRRKDLWGEDADEFKPDRWLGRKHGWEFLPFNGGPRVCIGQQFALTQAGYVIVRMLQKFDKIEGVGNSWEMEEKGGCGYVRQNCTLVSCPADGVKIRLHVAEE